MYNNLIPVNLYNILIVIQLRYENLLIVLLSLKNRNGAGPEKFPNIVLKECAVSLSFVIYL